MPKTLKQYIVNKIKAHGSITIAEYMNMCLYNEQFGYYRTRNPFGAFGDFVTAPEISQMFGELIGVWVQDLWQRSGQKLPLNIIEFGPGQGTMMADLMRIIPAPLAQQTKIHLVEINEVLIKVQKEKLTGLNVDWHESIHDALNCVKDEMTIILANEFFDALPIHQLIKTDLGWQERYVCVDENDELAFTTGVSKSTSDLPGPEMSEVANGSVYETCPSAIEIIEVLCKFLRKNDGAMLTIDYGVVQNLLGNTLQAIRDHSFNDVLKDPGNADLTAHVNFFKLIEHASQFDVNIYGPNLQGTFLSELGINIRAQALKANATEMQSAEIDRSVHRLTNAIQMGNLFKVLCITSNTLPKPSGFATCSTSQHLSLAG